MSFAGSTNEPKTAADGVVNAPRFKRSSVAFFGRTHDEYLHMLALDLDSLRGLTMLNRSPVHRSA